MNKVSSDILEKLFRIYDTISSLNFIGNIAFESFKLLNRPNELDEKDRNNFIRFSKMGSRFLEISIYRDIDEVIEGVKNEIEVNEGFSGLINQIMIG